MAKRVFSVLSSEPKKIITIITTKNKTLGTTQCGHFKQTLLTGELHQVCLNREITISPTVQELDTLCYRLSGRMAVVEPAFSLWLDVENSKKKMFVKIMFVNMILKHVLNSC